MSSHKSSKHHHKHSKTRYVYDSNIVQPKPKRKIRAHDLELKSTDTVENKQPDNISSSNSIITEPNPNFVLKSEPEICRICHDEINTKKSSIIKPCHCNSYVHQKCLQEWLRHKNQAVTINNRCEVCNYTYDTKISSGCCLKIGKSCGNLFTENRFVFWLINWFIPLVLGPLLWKFETVLGFRAIFNQEIFPIRDERIVGSIFLILNSCLYIVLNGGTLIYLAIKRCKIPSNDKNIICLIYIFTVVNYLVIIFSHLIGYVVFFTGKSQRIGNININHPLVDAPSFITFTFGFLSLAIFFLGIVLLVLLFFGISIGISILFEKCQCQNGSCFQEKVKIVDKKEELAEV